MTKEDSVHFLWKLHLVPKKALKTTKNQTTEILSTQSYSIHHNFSFLAGWFYTYAVSKLKFHFINSALMIVNKQSSVTISWTHLKIIN